MALKIKFARIGSRSNPSYRIVVAEGKSKRDSGYMATVGTYDPKTNPPTVRLNRDLYSKWSRFGATPTKSVWHAVKKEVGR